MTEYTQPAARLILAAALLVSAASVAAGCSERRTPQTTAMPPVDPPAARAETSDVADEVQEAQLSLDEPTLLMQSDGLRLDEQKWRFDGRQGFLWRVRLPRKAAARVVTAESLTRVDALTANSGHFAAVNGGFYRDTITGYEPLGLVMREGRAESKLTRDGGSGVVFDDGNQLRIVHRDKFEPRDDTRHALQSIDRIIDAGKNLVRKRTGTKLSPRVAIALTDDAVWLALAAGVETVSRSGNFVELKKTGHYGLPLWAFAECLRQSVGPRVALNLDGGISTQMLVRLDDGRSFEVRGVEGVLNALVVSPRR